VTGKGPAGNPIKTDSHEPKAHAPNLNDSKCKAIALETLKNPRSTGQVYFCWYLDPSHDARLGTLLA
jgi:hypothetical protein